MVRTFSVEHAKSGRSGCKGCKSKIAKDELRMGTHNDDFTKWYHVACFKKKIRKGPKSSSNITGFKKLSSKNKKKVNKILYGSDDDSSSSSDDDESESDDDSDDDIPISQRTRNKNKKKPQKRGRKRKRISSSDDDDDDDGPPLKKIKLNVSNVSSMSVATLKSHLKKAKLVSTGIKSVLQQRLKDYIKDNKKLIKQQKKNKKDPIFQAKCLKEQKENKKLKDSLISNTVADLKEMLKKNEVKRTGNKSVIIDRIIDCKMYGKYPRCPKCGGGTLSVTYKTKYGHDGQGKWTCKGYMDDDEYKFCRFSSETTFARDKWVN